MATITSDELNYLVFRYLQESGFTHAAFTLGYEASLTKTNINGNDVPPGALVSFIQKGLQYIELEANIGESGSDMDGDFALLQPIDLLTKDVDELKRIIRERKEKKEKDKEREREKEKEKEREKEREKVEREREREREKERQEREREREKEREKEREQQRLEKLEREREEKVKVKVEESTRAAGGGPAVGEGAAPIVSPGLTFREIASDDVTILEGHTEEVFICAWSPTGSLLASGSGDSTARIWSVPEGPSGMASREKASRPLVLKHFKGRTNEKSKDVTTLDWNGDGSLLATGSYDGQARIWGKDGELKATLNRHKGPIFSLKWNKKGDCLLSGSVDKTAIVWDAKSGDVKQQFEFHAAPTLDVDWRNNLSFATCSTDKMIYVCKLGDTRPVKSFSGHQDEVNAIKWDPTGSLLASCSDDCTAKIWSLKQEKCVHDLREHTKEIYTIKWSPTGPNSTNPNLPLLLASASFDATIKMWDVERGVPVINFTQHTEPVYAVAFSPNGRYLASGSFDRCLHIWDVHDGALLRTFRGSGGIFEVCWHRDGEKVAACFSNNTVSVLDFRM